MDMPVCATLTCTVSHGDRRGTGLRSEIKIIASGKVLTGMSIVRMLGIGADVCNAARAMMYALGCIQALKCNTNRCPTGTYALPRSCCCSLA